CGGRTGGREREDRLTSDVCARSVFYADCARGKSWKTREHRGEKRRVDLIVTLTYGVAYESDAEMAETERPRQPKEFSLALFNVHYFSVSQREQEIFSPAIFLKCDPQPCPPELKIIYSSRFL
ncbi:hypothetical protein PFISCL1PPCAC_924, partial [Pristionchus fissidentatus]